ncbi:chemotaxis protein CheW [bacterium]|nr:chemotaxis protein CheW [bacterium]
MNVEGLSKLNQYITFRLDKETYAFDIATVQSVLDFDKITKVPKTPDFMRGVINLRGSVVPIVDMKRKFGMGCIEKTVDTCIIIVEVELDGDFTVLGCLVDSVNEVIDLLPDDIEPAPKIGTRLNTEFITGMGKNEEGFIILLNLNKIFSADELTIVQEAGSSGKSKKKKEKKVEAVAETT